MASRQVLACTLAALMEERGWTVPSLAEASYVDQSLVHRWLKGQRKRAREETLQTVARVLGVPLDVISREDR
jgi:transcriptional regulator with XRE-family HTH domain